MKNINNKKTINITKHLNVRHLKAKINKKLRFKLLYLCEKKDDNLENSNIPFKMFGAENTKKRSNI